MTLREWDSPKAVLMSGYSSKRSFALAFCLSVHFSGDIMRKYLDLARSSGSVSPLASRSGTKAFIWGRLCFPSRKYGAFFIFVLRAFCFCLNAFLAAFSAFVASRLCRILRLLTASTAIFCIWNRSSTLYAQGKTSSAMAAMLLEKSIVMTPTCFRTISGTSFNAATTSSTWVPLMMAAILPLRPCPSLFDRMVNSSPSLVEVSSMLIWGPKFSGKTKYLSAWDLSSHCI